MQALYYQQFRLDVLSTVQRKKAMNDVDDTQGRINHCANCSTAWGPTVAPPPPNWLIFLAQMTSTNLQSHHENLVKLAYYMNTHSWAP